MKSVFKSMALIASVFVATTACAKEDNLHVTGYVFENKDGSETKVACRDETRTCMVETDDVDDAIDGKTQSLKFPDNWYTSEVHLNDKDSERIFTLYMSNSVPYSITYWKKKGGERYDSKYSEKKSLDFDAKEFYKSAL